MFIRRKNIISKLSVIILIISITTLSLPTLASSSIAKKKKLFKLNKQSAISVQNELDRTTAEHQRVFGELQQTETNLYRLQKKIEKTAADLANRRKYFSKRINNIYRHGELDFVEVFLGSTNFTDFANRFAYFNDLLVSDVGLIDDIKAKTETLQQQKTALNSERNKFANLTSSLKRQKNRLAAKLDNYQRLLASLQKNIKKEQLTILAQARLARTRNYSYRSSFVTLRLASGLVFPVAGPNSFSNDWGNPRSGGRRHKGTDIFARSGTPVVAVTSGTVTQKSGGLGGLTVRLHGSDGNTYYYAHLSGYASSGRVSQGQVIGYVGSSGNASGTSPHLHFEIWPGGSGAMNPYPTLASLR